jgi:nitrogen fixation/metabolism regulation signal transduction histidine kinase
MAALVGIVVACVAGAFVARELSRPMVRLTNAARQMKDSQLSKQQAAALAETPGNDEVAELSRVFGRMACEVIQREESLHQQVEVLTIQIDEAKRRTEVAEITDSQYFQALALKSREARARRASKLSD